MNLLERNTIKVDNNIISKILEKLLKNVFAKKKYKGRSKCAAQSFKIEFTDVNIISCLKKDNLNIIDSLVFMIELYHNIFSWVYDFL
jgi:hypothetical protein